MQWSSLHFFFNDTATTDIYTLPLPGGRPIAGKAIVDFGLLMPRQSKVISAGLFFCSGPRGGGTGPPCPPPPVSASGVCLQKAAQ